jgi:hypothetical protein
VTISGRGRYRNNMRLEEAEFGKFVKNTNEQDALRFGCRIKNEYNDRR